MPGTGLREFFGEEKTVPRPASLPCPLMSVVIPAHNAWETLKLALPPLLTQGFPRRAFEIIVVDDGSTDGTGANLRRMSLTESVLVLRQRKRGPASARNLGIRKARGRYVLFLDADVIPAPGLLVSHMEMLKRFPRGVIQGRVLPHPRTSTLDASRPSYRRGAGLRNGSRLDSRVITWNLSARKEHLDAVQGFDERFSGFGFHDFDLGYRLVARLGLEVRYSSKAAAYHLGCEDLRSHLEKMYQRGHSFIRFLRLHPEVVEEPETGADWSIKKALARIIFFQPYSRKKARTIRSRLFHSRGKMPLRELLDAAYYAFEEGAFTALARLPGKRSVLCPKP